MRGEKVHDLGLRRRTKNGKVEKNVEGTETLQTVEIVYMDIIKTLQWMRRLNDANTKK